MKPLLPLAALLSLTINCVAQDPLPDDAHWWYKKRPVSGEPNALVSVGRYVYAAGSFEYRDRNDNRGDGFGRFNLDLEDWEGIPGMENVNGVGWAVHAGDDGMIYFGGNDNLSGVAGAKGVGRFNPTTNEFSALISPTNTLDSVGQEGGPTNGRVFAIVKIGNLVYVGGEFTGPAGSPNREKYIRSFDLTTSRWSALGNGLTQIPNVPGRVNALIELADGSLLAGGNFVGGLARWDGTTWSTYAGGIPDDTGTVRALKLGPDGTLYVGGGFDRVGSGATTINASRIASWNGTAWDSMNGGFDTTLQQSNGTDFDADGVFDITFGPGGHLYVSGDFDATAGRANTLTSKVAMWTGTEWTNLGSGVGSSGTQNANTLVGDNRGGLLVGGVFSEGFVNSSSGSFKIARWVPDFEFGTDYEPGAAFNHTTEFRQTSPGNFAITIETRSDADYQLQSSPDLRTWSNLGTTLRGRANRQGFTIESATNNRFYRFLTTDPF